VNLPNLTAAREFDVGKGYAEKWVLRVWAKWRRADGVERAGSVDLPAREVVLEEAA
jgi:hypothetical protein